MPKQTKEQKPETGEQELIGKRLDLANWVTEWSDEDIWRLWTLGLVVKNDRGNTITPIEDAIVSMGIAYAASIEPAATFEMGIHHLELCVEEAKENFSDALEIARLVNSRYPNALAGTSSEAAE